MQRQESRKKINKNLSAENLKNKIGILDLPKELFLHIMTYYINSKYEVYDIMLTCKLFKILAENDELWKLVCLKTFKKINLKTFEQSGNWKSFFFKKSLIENRRWKTKIYEPIKTLSNQQGMFNFLKKILTRKFQIALTSLAVNKEYIACGGMSNELRKCNHHFLKGVF